LLGDTLLQDINKTRFPENWSGKAYDFVLHWKQQVMKYEALEIEEISPMQKLQLLMHAVTDVPELAYVKQVSDQGMARGNTPLEFEGYTKLLLSACSTYDKKRFLEENPVCVLYPVVIFGDDGLYPFNGTLDGELTFFKDGFNPFDDIMEEEFEFFEGDPEALDILEGNTKSNHIRKHLTTGDAQPKLIFLRPEEWI
jgi:hypothetical protein